MGDKTGIQWTDATWNPIRGCSRVSAGCENCYAEHMAARFSKPGMAYHGLAIMGAHGPRWTREVRMITAHLDDPMRWRRPRRIFVNSMSDLFHEGLTNEQIAALFGIMAASPQHTFQSLTKRSARQRAWYQWSMAVSEGRYWGPVMAEIGAKMFRELGDRVSEDIMWKACNRSAGASMPLRNVHVGVSVEDQKTANERLDDLLNTPGAVRWVSYEPALALAKFSKWLVGICPYCGDPWRPVDEVICGSCRKYSSYGHNRINGIVVGGESGPGARPFDVEWARSVKAECEAHGTAYFLKQLGSQPGYKPEDEERQGNMFAGFHHYDEASGLHIKKLKDSHGSDMSEWPHELRGARAWPKNAHP